MPLMTANPLRSAEPTSFRPSSYPSLWEGYMARNQIEAPEKLCDVVKHSAVPCMKFARGGCKYDGLRGG